MVKQIKTIKTWNQILEMLISFYVENNRLPFPRESRLGVKLGKWVSIQVRRYKEGSLTEERILSLEKVDKWIWRYDFTEDLLVQKYYFCKEELY